MIIKRIVNIPSPNHADGPNRISWASSMKGDFSVKSSYWSLMENSWNLKDHIWKTPWTFKDPHRI